MSTQKAIALRNAIKDGLFIRLGLTCTESFDSDGNPLLRVGAASAGSAGCFIRVSAEGSIQKDILGLAQKVFTPHIVDVAFEGNDATTTSTLPNVANTMAITTAILGEVLAKGAKTRVWLGPTGTAPSDTTFDTAGYLKATWQDLQYPLMAAQ